MELTEEGNRRFNELRQVLSEVGYLSQRAKLLRVSQFSQLDDYENTVEAIGPGVMASRRNFLQWAGIQPGMNVLELGCGPGSLTLNAGLADLVGPSGHVVGMDPALGMLARARKKLERYDYRHVEFRQGHAEELPYEDQTFDAVIGVAFLHFTDIPVAVKEMFRVTKPRGIVASLHGLSFPVQIPFISEWFQPLLGEQSSNQESKRDMMPDASVVPAIFNSMTSEVIYKEFYEPAFYNDPEKVVKLFIESIDMFEGPMSQLPWGARQQMISTLIERGKDIRRKYPDSDLIFDFPSQFVRGIVV